MDYVLEITGGLGKHLLATSLIKWINEKFPESKITVISAFPEIFEYNPRIHRNLHLSQPYLFEDYIKGNDFRKGEPYALYEYYRDEDKKHIMELYPKAYGFNELNENPESEIYLTKGEELDGEVFRRQNGNYITFQAFGGLINGMTPSRMKIDSDQRDMDFELACKIVAIFFKAGIKVVQARSQSERPIPGTIQINVPFRNFIPISKYSLGHVGIDSSMMHVAATLKKPQLIFWGGTHKDNLGYGGKGVFNVANKFSMHCRPHLQLPDRKGVFPFKDENEGKEFEYTNEELEKYLKEFIDFIKGGIDGKTN